jgi:hypothetical protein
MGVPHPTGIASGPGEPSQMTNGIRITAYLQATNRGYIQRQEIAVETATRSAVTYGLALAIGAALFFLIFAAVFNGVWSLLILFLLGYAVVGFLGVRKGGVGPSPLAMSLVLPAVPWVLWIFPASIREAGLLRALWWPGFALFAYLLAWLGGIIAMRSRKHRGSSST